MLYTTHNNTQDMKSNIWKKIVQAATLGIALIGITACGGGGGGGGEAGEALELIPADYTQCTINKVSYTTTSGDEFALTFTFKKTNHPTQGELTVQVNNKVNGVADTHTLEGRWESIPVNEAGKIAIQWLDAADAEGRTLVADNHISLRITGSAKAERQGNFEQAKLTYSTPQRYTIDLRGIPFTMQMQ